MLCLETEPRTFRIFLSALSRNRAIEKIPRIKLQSGLRCKNLHDASAYQLENGGRQSERVTGFIQHPVVVIAAAEFQLLIGRLYPGTDRRRFCKVERGPFHGSKFGGRDRSIVGRGKTAGIER